MLNNSHNNPHPYTKYRPAFTLTQLIRIADLVSQSTSDDDIAIKRILIPLIAKVEIGAISPAYKLSEIHAAKQHDKSQRERYENDLMSPEESQSYESFILGV